MKKIVWAMLLSIWVLLAVIGHAKAQGVSEEGIEQNQLYAQAAVLMDGQSGRVLYGKNADQVLAMASTTKIMTCIIALEYGTLSDVVEISSYAASMPEVKLGVRAGECYRLEDLLYSLMLESHNDVAVAIAEHIGKQYVEALRGKTVTQFNSQESKTAVAAFAKLMNDKALELGCENTYFITPNGLDGTEKVVLENGDVKEKFHSTTATELARIMSYCVLESSCAELFLKITQTPSHSFGNSKGRYFSCSNHNAFLNMMEGVISGKTGFTNKAGYCYVGALENEGRTFVVALLACGWPSNKTYKWSDARKLMTYGLENYYFRYFLEETEAEKWNRSVPVWEGQTDHVGEEAFVGTKVLYEQEDRTGLLMKQGEQVCVEYDLVKCLHAPVEEGMKVGEVRYLVDEKVYHTLEIVTAESVEKIDWQWCLEQIFSCFLCFD